MSGWEDQLEELAARVSSLEWEVSALESENERLRTRLSDDRPDDASPPAARLDRRSLLRLGGAAAAVGAGSVLLRPDAASAAAGQPVNQGAENDAGASTTGLTSTHNTDAMHVANTGTGAGLIVDASPSEGTSSINAVSDGDGPAMVAQVTNANADPAPPAIVGMAIDGGGVLGITSGGGPAITGWSSVGTGSSMTGIVFSDDPGAANPFAAYVDASEWGLLSRIYGATSDARAIEASQDGTASAVYAQIRNSTSSAGAVIGTTAGTGAGLDGRSTKGVGGKFTGKTAQVQLVPSTASTHPTSGSAGQLFVDRSKRLWFCKGGTNWKQLA